MNKNTITMNNERADYSTCPCKCLSKPKAYELHSDHEILIFRKQQKIVYKQQKYMLRH